MEKQLYSFQWFWRFSRKE